MKAAFLETYPDLKIPEKENIIRFKNVFEAMGHEFYVLSPEGIEYSSGIHADNLNIDVIFTADNSVKGMEILPDSLTLSVGWVPAGYLPYSRFQQFVSLLNCFDNFIPGFDSNNNSYLLDNFTNAFLPIDKYFYPSVNKSNLIEPQLKEKYDIFYVGINFDKGKSKGRHYNLLKLLDEKNILRLYGPEKIGETRCWEGFKNYKGEIPFDGDSILKEINKAGICLALQSKIHNRNEYITNRIYEACAAGAIIISDDSPKIRNIFGDSLYYVDIYNSDDEIIADVMNIYNEINNNPQVAFEKAKQAQNIFKEKFSLENSAQNLITATQETKQYIKDIAKQTDKINVIAFINNQNDLEHVIEQINRQEYKNIEVLFSIPQNTNLNFQNITFPYKTIETCEKSYGKRFTELKSQIECDYFVFVDEKVDWQKRHLYKQINSIKHSDNLWGYCGTYVRQVQNGKTKKYTCLNNKPINHLEFFAPFTYMDKITEDECIYNYFDLENKFALNSTIFNKTILELSKNEEIKYIERAIHMYFAMIAIIKQNDVGQYCNAITAGYRKEEEKELLVLNNKEYFVNLNEESFIDFHRCDGLTIKDIYSIFYKYNPYGKYVYPHIKSENLDKKELILSLNCKYMIKHLKKKLKYYKFCRHFNRSSKIIDKIKQLESQINILRNT